MLKAAGVCMIFLASAGMGFSFSMDMKRRVEELKYIKKIMLMLRGEIKYTRSPLPDAFFRIGLRVKQPFSNFLKTISEDLEELEGYTFQKVWENRIREDLNRLKITKADTEQFIRLGENFGYLDGEMQLGTIDLYLEQLESDIGQAEQMVQSKTKMYNCLGIMGGIFLVIIIL